MKILVGTPIPEADVKALYTFAIVRLIQNFHAHRPDVEFELQITQGALLPMLRNQLASRVLNDPSYSHLLFVDSDIAFSFSAVQRMLEFGQDFVGCLYPVRQLSEPQRFVASGAIVREEAGRFRVQDGFARTRRMGMGLTLVSRRVLERLAEHDPTLVAAPPPGSFYAERGLARVLQAFDPLRDPDDGLLTGEDIAFCRRWTDLGGEIWALVDEAVTHVGYHNFTGRMVQSS